MKEYQPCGEAWKKEMSRFTKREILDILAPKLIEMNKKIAELEKQVEDLKCCGNCKNYKSGGACIENNHWNEVCNNWQSDGLTRSERG